MVYLPFVCIATQTSPSEYPLHPGQFSAPTSRARSGTRRLDLCVVPKHPPSGAGPGDSELVHATPQHAGALNGCSDLLVEMFGERRVHARSVLGATSLRAGLPVVLKAVVEFS